MGFKPRQSALRIYDLLAHSNCSWAHGQSARDYVPQITTPCVCVLMTKLWPVFSWLSSGQWHGSKSDTCYCLVMCFTSLPFSLSIERWSALEKLPWTQKWKSYTDDSKPAPQPTTTYLETMWKRNVFLCDLAYAKLVTICCTKLTCLLLNVKTVTDNSSLPGVQKWRHDETIH